jgi:hypothetical protein
MLELRMLTTRRRAVKRKQRRTRRLARKTRVRKHRGGGNGNQNNDDYYAGILEKATKDTAPIKTCDFMSNSKMAADIKKYEKLFETYYKDFFAESDKELNKEISKLKGELKDPNTSDYQKQIIEYQIEDLESIPTTYSMEELMKILYSHGESPIREGSESLNILRGFNQYDRLPRLPADIRVWRTLKDVHTIDTRKYRQIHLETGRLVKRDKTREVYGVDKITDITGERLTGQGGAVSTSIDYDSSIIFGEESIYDGIDICMEFVIPKGTLAIPINREADPRGYDGGREIIILDECEFIFKKLKCARTQARSAPIGVYEVDLKLRDFR